MKGFRPLAALLALLLVLTLSPALAAPEQREVTVLFTHDLHSHFLPQEVEGGGQSGGYARLMTALQGEREKHPDALTLDAGDFSIGSLIQTLYTTTGAELRTMGAMGYDATTAGNHEFDHTGAGFGEMLMAAKESGDPLPALLMSNYAPDVMENPDWRSILEAMDNYGVRERMTIERGGITYGIFGLMGVDSDSCAPTSGFYLEDAAQAAKTEVAQLRKEGAEFIICLSHSGTDADNEDLNEDVHLAQEVEGIDLIISGHSHTTLPQPIVVGDTYIVSAGPYCQNLGSVTFTRSADGSKTLSEYTLIPIDGTISPDPTIETLVEGWKDQVGDSYLNRYGLTYDQVLTHADFTLKTPTSGVQEGNGLGYLVSDAFLWATENLWRDYDESVPTVTVTADGVLRSSLWQGEITTSDAFDVLSMGVGSDGTSGFPLVAVYLTGKELKAAAEVDASVTPIMPAAQLYMTGLHYTFNPHRMFFNRVTNSLLVWLRYSDRHSEVDGWDTKLDYTDIDDDQLYRVVTGMYSAQMLGTVKSKSMGLLSLEPKLADGSPVTDFDECILRDKEGNEIKEWYALAAYLQTFGEAGLHLRYEQPLEAIYKAVRPSWNPVELLRSPNWITLTVLALVLLIVAAVVLLTRFIRRRRTPKSPPPTGT